MPGRPVQTTNYLSAVLTSSAIQQRNDLRQQLNQVNSNCYPATSSTNSNTNIDNNNVSFWDSNSITNQMQLSNDPLLSAILDQVIDIVPNMLEPTEPDLQTQTETMAIEVIQKSLMQYESVVKSTSALTMPGTPPAYTTANVSIILFNLGVPQEHVPRPFLSVRIHKIVYLGHFALWCSANCALPIFLWCSTRICTKACLAPFCFDLYWEQFLNWIML